MFSVSFSRWPFLVAVALLAAVVSDVLVEAIANTGSFGRAFIDTNDASILPALAVAALLASGVIGGHMLAACRWARPRRRDWLAAVAGDLAVHAPLRDSPYILAMQFSALFAMESAEGMIADGRIAGGLLWLGGPPLIAAAVHVAVGLVCTLAAGWLIRVSVPHFASFVCTALEFVLCARAVGNGGVFVRRAATAFNHIRALRVRRISGRAPPFVAPLA